MAAEALQALNRILQYRQQSERADVQEALALMEFAAKKRVSDYNLASKMIDDSAKYNSQLQLQVASDFIQKSNLDQFYNAMTIDEDAKYTEVQNEIKDIAKDLRDKSFFKGAEGKGKIAFNKVQSEEIASALWAFKTTKDPSAVMSLAEDIRGVYERSSIAKRTGAKLSSDDATMIYAFKNIQAEEGMLHSLNQAAASLQNEDTIMKERLEMFQGDYKFDEELISVLDPTQTEKIGKSLNDIEIGQLAPQIDNLIAQQEAQREEDDFDIPVGGIAKGTALTGAIGVAVTESQSQVAQSQWLKDVVDHAITKVRGDEGMMGADEFKDKYNMTKKVSKTTAGKKELARQALEYGRSQTTLGRGIARIKSPFQWAKGLDINWKSPAAINIGTLAAPVVLPMIGEAIAGDVGRISGRMASTTILTNQVIRSGIGKRTFMNYLMSKFPMIAGKAGAIAMADSPAFPLMDVVALGIAINDVIEIYKEWTDLYSSE
jgi:hypothetical protein